MEPTIRTTASAVGMDVLERCEWKPSEANKTVPSRYCGPVCDIRREPLASSAGWLQHPGPCPGLSGDHRAVFQWDCDLPQRRFDPAFLLPLLRGKHLLFAGDSLSYQRMLAFVCMLQQTTQVITHARAPMVEPAAYQSMTQATTTTDVDLLAAANLSFDQLRHRPFALAIQWIVPKYNLTIGGLASPFGGTQSSPEWLAGDNASSYTHGIHAGDVLAGPTYAEVGVMDLLFNRPVVMLMNPNSAHYHTDAACDGMRKQNADWCHGRPRQYSARLELLCSELRQISSSFPRSIAILVQASAEHFNSHSGSYDEYMASSRRPYRMCLRHGLLKNATTLPWQGVADERAANRHGILLLPTSRLLAQRADDHPLTTDCLHRDVSSNSFDADFMALRELLHTHKQQTAHGQFTHNRQTILDFASRYRELLESNRCVPATFNTNINSKERVSLQWSWFDQNRAHCKKFTSAGFRQLTNR